MPVFNPPRSGRERISIPPAGTARPGIYVASHDYARLENVVHTASTSGHPVARFLKTELARALVRPLEELPRDIVRMNRRVLFRVNDLDKLESRYLVFPQQYHPTGQYVCILSPLGVALLGLRAGNEMPFIELTGTAKRVTVEKVV